MQGGRPEAAVSAGAGEGGDTRFSGRLSLKLKEGKGSVGAGTRCDGVGDVWESLVHRRRRGGTSAENGLSLTLLLELR